MAFTRVIVAAVLMSGAIGSMLHAAEPSPKVPDGFTIEKVAGSPVVERPLMGGFDDAGRLYLAESSGKNLWRAVLEKELPNFVRRLEDADGDGRFERSNVFADKMTFPQGALWYRGAVYVASPPGVWKLEDLDGDGVAEKRTQIVGGFGYTGNAADVHGCFLGPEGRIWWCDGRHGHEIKDADGRLVSKGQAARIFSCRTDGSDVRVHCGGGMDNPVEIDFTPTGEMLGTVNILLEQRGDCLVHWMHGGVYPRRDQQKMIAEFPRTGDLLPPVHDFGHVAVSGMTRYRSGQFGDKFRDNYFVTEFNTHKVVRVVVEREGTTYRAKQEDFVTCDHPDFHPTDVLEDADGSLLVIDTGGWFRIGCPVSQVPKPDVLGGIWRVRRKNDTPPADPRGAALAWDVPPARMVHRLGDPRFVVRERTIDRLAQSGDDAIEAIDGAERAGLSELARRNIVWVLARMDTGAGRRRLVRLANDGDPAIRLAAVYALGMNGAPTSTSLKTRLSDPEPTVRREAATAIGRIVGWTLAPDLVEALADPVDRVHEHAIIYALIELGNVESTRRGLADPRPQVRRGALIALDQMRNGNLTREMVAPLLDTNDRALQAAVLGVIRRRDGWGAETAAILRTWITAPSLDASQCTLLRGAITSLAADAQIQRLVARSLTDAATPVATKRVILEAVARRPVEPAPDGWVSAVEQCLGANDGGLVQQAVATASTLSDVRLDAGLVKIAYSNAHEETRIAAIVALCKRGYGIDDKSFGLLRDRVVKPTGPLVALTAAAALAATSLTPQQLEQLIPAVEKAGPMELPLLMEAFAKNPPSARVADTLFTSLSRAPGKTALGPNLVTGAFIIADDRTRERAHALITANQPDAREEAARLEPYRLALQLQGGDAKRGRTLFFAAKSACAACHRVGGQGESIGPDLSTIGKSRARRDLWEAVLNPSASLARGYESFSVRDANGTTTVGVIAAETPDEIVLRTTRRDELRIRRDQIDQIAPSTTSIMPQGLEQTMTPAELADLLAFLESLR